MYLCGEKHRVQSRKGVYDYEHKGKIRTDEASDGSDPGRRDFSFHDGSVRHRTRILRASARSRASSATSGSSSQHSTTPLSIIPKPNEIYQVGTISNIVQSLKLPDGNTKVLVEGIERARILQLNEEDGYWKANLRLSPFRNQTLHRLRHARVASDQQFEQYVKLSQNLNADQVLAAIKVDDIGRLADTICAHMVLSIEEKQELIEIFNPVERCKRLADMLDVEIEKLHVDRSVQNRVKRQMERAQKEYYLNEKIKAIQRELGKKDEKSEIEELRRKIETAGMPKDALRKGDAGTEAAGNDAADVGRIDSFAKLSRLAAGGAVEEEVARDPRYRRSPKRF